MICEYGALKDTESNWSETRVSNDSDRYTLVVPGIREFELVQIKRFGLTLIIIIIIITQN